LTTLLVNGRIHSPTHIDATAMAVRDGVVAWLGSDHVARAQFPDAEVTDLAGAFVAPGFVDSHVHVTATGLSLTGLDLRAATSRRHCVDLLADYAHKHPDGPVWGHGWDESRWPEPLAPSTADLDGAVGQRPVYLARVDAHSAAASTALRRLVADLTARAGFHPRAPLTAASHHAVRGAARALLTAEQRGKARVAALDAAAAAGIVCVHECAGPDIAGLDDWLELRATDHGVEVIGYWGQAVRTADEAYELVRTTGAHGLAGDLFVDGALGSHTAWLSEPYADAPHCGNGYLDGEAIAAHVAACTDAGVAAGFHVIGDAAVEAAVDGMTAVVNQRGAVAVSRCGHRLEHLEMVGAEQARLLGSWGVIASVQPGFDALWGGEHGMYARRLGSRRARLLNPLTLLASSGVPLAFGSDSPVTSMNPWRSCGPRSGIAPRAARCRRGRHSLPPPAAVGAPGECVTA